jgi:mono/diheme cytochrome c family protein
MRDSPSAGAGRLQARPLRNVLLGLVVLVVALLVVVQLVPYGRNHTNPSLQDEPAWDSAQTQALFTRACADCHSNRTVWPWYSNVAPVSWLVQHDVDEGRAYLNVSDKSSWQGMGDITSDMIQSGKMPSSNYTILHPGSVLTPAERQQLVDGLKASLGRAN